VGRRIVLRGAQPLSARGVVAGDRVANLVGDRALDVRSRHRSPQLGHWSSAYVSAGPSRRTRARNDAHLKCATASPAPGGAKALVGHARRAFELAQAARGGWLGAQDASSVKREAVAVVTSFGLEPAALGSVRA
jgi:hypothetical protein